MNSLEASFHQFMATLSDAECIDKLIMPAGSERAKRADYFLNQRRVIVELKSLETDPSGKVEIALEKRREDDDFPQFYGQADLMKVLEKLPDGNQLKEKIALRVTRSIKDAFQSAKRQLAVTRSSFDLPNSDGLLVLLNSAVDILDPRLVGRRCRALLDQFDPNDKHGGSINHVWFIQATHHAGVRDGNNVVPSLFVESGHFPLSETSRIRIERLVQQRAAFEGVPFIGNADLSTLDHMESFARATKAAEEPQTRHEQWRAEYKARPYLAGLDDNSLLVHSSRMFRRTLPFFALNGATAPARKIDDDPAFFDEAMAGWTHSLEELNNRLIDVRRLQPYLKLE